MHIWDPFIQEFFMPSLVEICSVFLEKKIKIWKVYRWTDGRRTKGDQKSSIELLGQASYIPKTHPKKFILSCIGKGKNLPRWHW